MADHAFEAVEAEPDRAIQRLTWVDGVVFSMTMPAALIATLGYSILSLGTWLAAGLWGASMAIAVLANRAYSELASMFPRLSGGIAVYAWEGWRSRFTPAGPIAAFGYWFAWSSSMAVYAGIVGDLVMTQWFPSQSWRWDLTVVDVTFPRLVAAAVLIGVWWVNVRGLRVTMWMAYAAAVMLVVPVVAFAVGPYLAGEWSLSRLTPSHASWRLIVVWLYIMCWTSLGVETCATFTPEYRSGARDAVRALRAAALLSLGIFVLLPVGASGAAGTAAITKDPLGFYVPAFQRIAGGGSDVVVALLVGSLLLVILTCMADSSRALSGMSEQGLTVRGFETLNRSGAPARAITFDLVVNLCLVFFLGSTLAIVATGNLGYVLAHVLALSALLLLRRDRPGWPRPTRVSRPMLPVVAALVVVLAVFCAIGAGSFDLTGYGGITELLIGLAILSTSVLLYAVRVRGQDGARLRLRQEPARTARDSTREAVSATSASTALRSDGLETL